MKKIIIEFFIIFTVLGLVFKYNFDIRYNLTLISLEFVKNVIPSLFPLLITSGYIKESIINKTNNKLIRFMCLSLSYMPANAIITNSFNELLFSSNVNPLFSFIMIKNIFNVKIAVIIVLTNLIFNYILLYKNINKSIIKEKNNLNIIDIVKNSSISLTYIYGSIIFCNILFTIIKNLINPKYLFFIEITNGYKIINKAYKHKLIPIIFLNSFGGISFFMQIKSINTNIKYTFLLKKLILSIFVLILTLFILMTYHVI